MPATDTDPDFFELAVAFSKRGGRERRRRIGDGGHAQRAVVVRWEAEAERGRHGQAPLDLVEVVRHPVSHVEQRAGVVLEMAAMDGTPARRSSSAVGSALWWNDVRISAWSKVGAPRPRAAPRVARGRPAGLGIDPRRAVHEDSSTPGSSPAA